MMSGRLSIFALLLTAGLAPAVVGCLPSIREDRTITFGSDGTATFQHGRNGVFTTDPTTGKPKQIFQPGEDDLAASPPLWNPSGKRMVFTVARSVDGQRTGSVGDSPAEGRRYASVPVRYSCWLYESATGGPPEKLFEANCDHVGCVAAGLAVAWHPDDRRVDFVDQIHPNQHQVFTFDITSRKVEAVALPAAEQIVLGSRSIGFHRSAVLGGSAGQSGLWIEDSQKGVWWQVPDSTIETASIEDLRELRPNWSRDGRRFAFVVKGSVRVCDITTRSTAEWFHSEATSTGNDPHPSPISDGLYWHANGTQIGVLDGTRLGLIGPDGWERELTHETVLSFAGWDGSGQRMAYVTAEPLPYSPDWARPGHDRVELGVPAHLRALGGGQWATLLIPNPSARSAVWFADADGDRPRKAVSGLRATFPHWSTTEPRLSVWLTVEPPYHLVTDDRLGMRPGDPAAVIDADTGALDWLPVNGTEHAQIGHVELRLGRTNEALRRFDEAVAGLPTDAPADWMFFRAVALRKAGREVDALKALRRFEAPAPTTRSDQGRVVRILSTTTGRMPHGDVFRPKHRYAVEAFASLEMVDEGVDFLLREFADTRSDGDRLSASLSLCQLLLLADRRAEYVDHIASELFPLVERVLAAAGQERESIARAVALTILPLAVPEFTASLDDCTVDVVNETIALLASREDDVGFACLLSLRTTSRRLGAETQVDRADARIRNHPAKSRWQLATGNAVDAEYFQRIRMEFLLQELLGESLLKAFGN
jgi:hypothetical protein